jgi:PIN domain nuclease of toxin-antitoxin system
MRLLLDTHVLIWWDDSAELKPATIAAIRDADEVYVSAVVPWEIAIKAALGRLKTRRVVADVTSGAGFVELPIFFNHVEAVAALPLHHRDPFDRMLAAQAIVEGLTIVTRDPVFSHYGVRVLAA